MTVTLNSSSLFSASQNMVQLATGGLCSAAASRALAPALETPAGALPSFARGTSCATSALFRAPSEIGLDDILKQGGSDPVLQGAIEGIPSNVGNTQVQMEFVLDLQAWAETRTGKSIRVGDLISTLDRQAFGGKLERYTSLPAAGRTIDVLLSKWPTFRSRFEALAQKEDPLEGMTFEGMSEAEKEKMKERIRWGVFLWRYEYSRSTPAPELCPSIDGEAGFIPVSSPAVARTHDFTAYLETWGRQEPTQENLENLLLEILTSKPHGRELSEEFRDLDRAEQLELIVKIRDDLELDVSTQVLTALVVNLVGRKSEEKKAFDGLILEADRYDQLNIKEESPDIAVQKLITEHKDLLEKVRKEFPQLNPEGGYYDNLVYAALAYRRLNPQGLSQYLFLRMISVSLLRRQPNYLAGLYYITNDIIARWSQFAPHAKTMAKLESSSSPSGNPRRRYAESHIPSLTNSQSRPLNKHYVTLAVRLWGLRKEFGLPEPSEGATAEAAPNVTSHSPSPQSHEGKKPLTQEERRLIQEIQKNFPQLKPDGDYYDNLIFVALAFRKIKSEDFSLYHFNKVVSVSLFGRSKDYFHGGHNALNAIIDKWEKFAPHAKSLASLPRAARGNRLSPRLEYARTHLIPLVGEIGTPALSSYAAIAACLWEHRREFELSEPDEPKQNSVAAQPEPKVEQQKLPFVAETAPASPESTEIKSWKDLIRDRVQGLMGENEWQDLCREILKASQKANTLNDLTLLYGFTVYPTPGGAQKAFTEWSEKQGAL